MASKKSTEMEIVRIERGSITFNILGRTPLITNAMSEKARQELLFPTGRKSAAQRAASLKHDPLDEYRSSMYRAIGDDAPTRILVPATAFKAALMSSAVDIPGAAKAQIGRLTFVENTYIDIYGIPQVMMSVVRSSDVNKTPDVRTRAVIPDWACQITVTYTKPMIKDPAVCNLMAAAGLIQGIGDWRPQKGSGNYGTFELVDQNNPVWEKIVAEGGRDAQDAAIADPEAFDSETVQLLSWFRTEVRRRGFASVS